MIECKNVSRQYGERMAVQELSMTINAGEFVVLIGTSGSGKSTMLKMINRLVEMSAGEIYLHGERITDMALTKLRRQIGYVIQSTGLFPHWSVGRNIATVPQLLGWPQHKIRQRVAHLMASLNLTPVAQFIDKYPHQLSGGQAQRVGVARALASDPDVLLMDEPFGALDPMTRTVLQEEVRRIQRQTGKTVIFVTHDMNEALALADRIAIMQAGELVQYARPIDLLIEPANDFVREFVGQSDLGLKLLSQRHVSQYLCAADTNPATSDHHWLVDARQHPETLIGGKLDEGKREISTAVNAQWLARPEMSMKEALSRMVWYRVAVLPVVDDEGALVGEVSLRSMMEPPRV